MEDWGRRDCFAQLEDYLYSPEHDRVCLIFGLLCTGKAPMLRQAIGRMMEDIVLLETTKAADNHRRVFKLQFAAGEFDMVICDEREQL